MGIIQQGSTQGLDKEKVTQDGEKARLETEPGGSAGGQSVCAVPFTDIGNFAPMDALSPPRSPSR